LKLSISAIIVLSVTFSSSARSLISAISMLNKQISMICLSSCFSKNPTIFFFPFSRLLLNLSYSYLR
ncbi:MAG TPA: hypothetical protein DEA34_02845, partial [Enterococcus sp.]|nr:hypothetical protein [Enterococcus sp.]